MPWPKIDEVCANMEAGKPLSPDSDGSPRWICRCPSHDDGRPSLMVIESKKFNGRPIFKCYAGCSPEDVCRAFGFDPDSAPHHSSSVRQPKRKPQLHARKDGEEYEYRNADGTLNFVVTRKEPKDFRQHQVDPQTGAKIWSLAGVQRTLFRLDRLFARKPLEVLWVVEGEVDVFNMEALGLTATTKAGGGGASWGTLAGQFVSLSPTVVNIIADLDEVGEKSALALRELLDQHGIPSAIFTSATGGPGSGADVTDHLEAGLPLSQLIETHPAQDPERPLTAEDLTEFGAATYLERTIGNQVMYVPGLEEPWHYQKEGIWFADRDEVDHLAREAFSQRLIEAELEGGGLLSAAKRFATVRGIEAALKLIRNTVKVPVRDLGELKHPSKLALKNGVLDLTNGSLSPPDPTLRFTMRSDLNYEKESPGCPRWMSFLEEVQPDPDVRSWLQMLFGVCLSGEMPQIVVCNIGGGLNGKSVAINTVMSVLGDYAGTADSSTFMSGRSVSGNEQRSDLTRLRGKRMVSASETDAGASLDEGFIKSWCGGEELVARAMYARNPISFEPQGKLILTSNHKPRIKEQDLGVWRRIRLIPWTVRIPREKVDDKIIEKLRTESAGILHWLVEGCIRFYAHGLDALPEVVASATAEYRLDEDEIGEFFGEECEEGVDHHMLSGDLYSAYVRWCEASNVKPMTKNKFGRRLTQRGLVGSRNLAGSRIWDGVRLKPTEVGAAW